jgi:membrane protein
MTVKGDAMDHTASGNTVAEPWWIRTRALGVVQWQRVEKSWPMRWWNQLDQMGFVQSCIVFAGLFVISFLPFLLLVSAALGSDFSHALTARSHLSPSAARDVNSLFAHKGGGVTSQSIIGLVLVALGGESLARNLQSWYAKVFDCSVEGWRAQARRLWWLGGAFGFVALQYVIARHVHTFPTARTAQLVLSVVFWWWTLHCLLAGSLQWRRLFIGGAATAALTTALGLLFSAFGSSSITSSQRIYGPVGTITVLIEVLVGLGVAVHLGALLGSRVGRLRRPGQVDIAS